MALGGARCPCGRDVGLTLILYFALIALGIAGLTVVILKVHARTKSRPGWWKEIP